MTRVALVGLFLSLQQAVPPVSTPEVGFQFFDKALQVAVIGTLLALTSWLTRRITKRQRWDPRRRADDGWKEEMEDRFEQKVQDLKQQLETVEGLSRNDRAATEGVKTEVRTLHDYVHDLSHRMGDQMNVMAGRVSEVSGRVSEVHGAMTGIAGKLDLAIDLFMQKRS